MAVQQLKNNGFDTDSYSKPLRDDDDYLEWKKLRNKRGFSAAMMTLGTILKFGPLKKAFAFSQAYPILMIWSAFKISKYITKMK